MPKAKITISVPYNQIKILDLGLYGTCKVEEISSKLFVDISLKTYLEINDIPDVTLGTSGDAKLIIENPKKLSIDSSGQLSIKVKGTVIKKIEIDSSGMTNINIDADLSEMANLFVKSEVLNKYIDCSGMCFKTVMR